MIPPPAPSHGIVNPSLETPDGPAIPDCWMRTGWGTNSAQWEQTSDAHSGTGAQRVTVTSFTSGDAKLLQRLDLGQCTEPIKPRNRYALQTWYQSSAPTQFALYYRTSIGRWTYWTSSSWFPPSRDWAQASWATPPVPDDAAGLAFGLALRSVGSLTTDDYAIAAAQGLPTPPTTSVNGLPLPPGGLPVVTLGVAMVVLLTSWVLRLPRRSAGRGVPQQRTNPSSLDVEP